MSSKYGNSVYTGCVKWFNRSGGWGFITITNEGHSDEEIFVRWDNLSCEGYKYLVQGEYVEFSIDFKPESQEGRQYQAANVSGVNGGKLMCETHREQRVSAAKHRQQLPRQEPCQLNRSRPDVRSRVPAPLPVPVAGHQWVLVPQLQAPVRPPRHQQQRRI